MDAAIVHNELPSPLPPDTIVADVEFLPDSLEKDSLYTVGVRARVRRMIQGSYSGDTLIARRTARSSCDVPFSNGGSGYIVAIPRGYEGGILIVEPFGARRGRQFTLPDGWTRPKSPR